LQILIACPTSNCLISKYSKYNAILTEGHESRKISSVCFDKQQGTLLLTVSDNGQAVCWNVLDQRVEFKRKLHARQQSKFIAVDWSSSSSSSSSSITTTTTKDVIGNFFGIFECGTVVSIFVSSSSSSTPTSSSSSSALPKSPSNRNVIYRVTTSKLDNSLTQVTALACCNNNSSARRPSGGSIVAIGLANGTVAVLRIAETTPENLVVTVLARLQHIHTSPIQGLQWHCNRAQASCAVCDDVGLLLASSSADGIALVSNVTASISTSEATTNETTMTMTAAAAAVCEMQSVVQLTLAKAGEARKSWCALAWHPAPPLSLLLSSSAGALFRWRFDSTRNANPCPV
jgi:WD40 repeat protein